MEMTLDGRKFHGVTEAMTSVQDDYIMTQLRRSGATDVLLGMDGLQEEERRARSREMFDRIVESGRKYKLLAGLLIEEGKTWNQAEAEKNAERFAGITAMEEKLTMNREIMRHVQFFFDPKRNPQRLPRTLRTRAPRTQIPRARKPRPWRLRPHRPHRSGS